MRLNCFCMGTILLSVEMGGVYHSDWQAASGISGIILARDWSCRAVEEAAGMETCVVRSSYRQYIRKGSKRHAFTEGSEDKTHYRLSSS